MKIFYKLKLATWSRGGVTGALWGITAGVLGGVFVSPSGASSPQVQLNRVLAEFFSGNPGAKQAPFVPIELEGDTLQLFLNPLREWSRGQLEPILQSLQKVRLQPGLERTWITAQWRQPVRWQFRPAAKAQAFELYEVRLPQQLSVSLKGTEGRVILERAVSPQGVDFLMQIPILPDKLRFRSAQLDLVTGEARIVVGGIWDHIALVAHARLFSGSGPRFDPWASLRENFLQLSWIPGLRWMFQ